MAASRAAVKNIGETKTLPSAQPSVASPKTAAGLNAGQDYDAASELGIDSGTQRNGQAEAMVVQRSASAAAKTSATAAQALPESRPSGPSSHKIGEKTTVEKAPATPVDLPSIRTVPAAPTRPAMDNPRPAALQRSEVKLGVPESSAPATRQSIRPSEMTPMAGAPYVSTPRALDLPVAATSKGKSAEPRPSTETIFRKASSSPSHAQPSTPPIIAHSLPGFASSSPIVSRAAQPVGGAEAAQGNGQAQTPDLKALARDIYPYIRKMLIIEKERMPFR